MQNTLIGERKQYYRKRGLYELLTFSGNKMLKYANGTPYIETYLYQKRILCIFTMIGTKTPKCMQRISYEETKGHNQKGVFSVFFLVF